MLGRHVQTSQTASVDKALHMLEAASNAPTPEHVKDFYDLVNEGDVLSLIDALLDAVRDSRAVDSARAHRGAAGHLGHRLPSPQTYPEVAIVR